MEASHITNSLLDGKISILSSKIWLLSQFIYKISFYLARSKAYNEFLIYLA